MTVYSKLTPIHCTCTEFVHPWTASCSVASTGLLLRICIGSFRLYSAVYLFSLLMRGRIPTIRDCKRTIQSICQSTAFLTMTGFLHCQILCIIRHFWGSYNLWTASFVPAFLASICAILIEQPSRRGPLCLYVLNGATETLFQMATYRGIVQPVRGGKFILFGMSSAILLYYFRQGIHLRQKDSIFDIIRFVIGGSEEFQIDRRPPINHTIDHPERYATPPRYGQKLLDAYSSIINYIRHKLPIHGTCPHSGCSCLYYSLMSGSRLFAIGLGIRCALTIVLQIPQIMTRGPGHVMKMLCRFDTLKLGIFLGSFSSLFRSGSCAMRWLTGRDHPLYALPIGLLTSLSFISYPDTTVALYVMWKSLQVTYNDCVQNGWLPTIPHFTFFLYCFCTAVLFHAAILEPMNLRPSYWKFLYSMTGGWVAVFNREVLNVYGLQTSKQLAEILKRTKTDGRALITL